MFGQQLSHSWSMYSSAWLSSVCSTVSRGGFSPVMCTTLSGVAVWADVSFSDGGSLVVSVTAFGTYSFKWPWVPRSVDKGTALSRLYSFTDHGSVL